MARNVTRAAGYTLIELMIVVALIGILASIAIPTFQAYLQRARAAEAPTFLGEIRQRQESYRAEFGQYCNASSASASAAISAGSWNPSTLPTGGERVAWDGTADRWDHLGAAPDGPSYFQYRTTAGPPGVESGVPGLGATEFWFVAQARGDLDDDGDTVIFEANSATSRIFIGDGSLDPLASGWE